MTVFRESMDGREGGYSDGKAGKALTAQSKLLVVGGECEEGGKFFC